MATGTPSLWDQIESSWEAFANLAAGDIAKVLGLWTAARAAVSTVATGIAAAASQTTINNALKQYHDVPLSAAALALMIIKNVLPDSTNSVGAPTTNYPPPYMTAADFGAASDEALLTGVSNDRFKAMVYANGESYGLIDAIRLMNRQKNLHSFTTTDTSPNLQALYTQGADVSAAYAIDETEFGKVAAYSNMRPEFIPDVLKLAHDTLSPADAVELAVKGILSAADAKTLYAAAGGMPEQFDLLYRGAGDAAGLEHAVELNARGIITDTQMNQIIGMSRLNPAFYYLYQRGGDIMAPMGRRWLPADVIGRMVQTNIMSKADAITYITEQGYSIGDATNLINTEEMQRVVHIRGATEAQIAEDWQAGLITQAQAVEALTNIGYQSWAIPIILDTYEARKVIAARNNVVTRTRGAVLVGGVTSAEAVADLESVGFSAPAAQEMVSDWTVEANTPTKVMPYSVVGFLLQGGIMGTTDGENYFRRSGYSAQDAEMMTKYYQSGITSPEVNVSGVPGPVEEEEPAKIPPAPTRSGITELGPPKPT